MTTLAWDKLLRCHTEALMPKTHDKSTASGHIITETGPTRHMKGDKKNGLINERIVKPKRESRKQLIPKYR